MKKWMMIPLSLVFLAPLAAEPAPTPAEVRISQARKALERAPDLARPHVDLALAYTRRARETADSAFYQKAHESLDRALEIAPDDYAARRIRTWALLGQHEFAQALDLARALNDQAPDDVLVYGFLADALVELGRYEEAADAVQWMLDLRPGNVPALTRAAYLRELHGFDDGAVDFLRKAFDRTPPNEREDRAWIMVQIAHVERQRAELDAADEAVAAALRLFPGYHYALAEKGRILLDRGRPAEASAALEQRYEAAPHPENLYELGRALDAAGESERAAEAYARFEREALAESDSWDNANRELVDYYVEVAGDTEKAVALASRELERRQDVFTRAALGWALYKAGEQEKARDHFRATREMGVLDARIRERAEIVLGDS